MIWPRVTIAQWKSRLMFLIHRLVFYSLHMEHHDVQVRIGQMVVSALIGAQDKT